MIDFSLAIHGGAGTILKAHSSPELELAYTQALNQALQAGRAILEHQGSAEAAVVAAVVSLENCPLFNAGKGSVFTKEGGHEMDASLMIGQDLNAGSCAGVKFVENPILLAQAILKKSQHVMLAGNGALQFALENELPVRGDAYFFTQFRYDQWLQIRDTTSTMLDHTGTQYEQLLKNKKFGTVGAVAKDQMGNLAAATSTGGMTNKQFNRIGDTPIIGSGCYANNRTCAISATGHGEPFIRAVAAYDVSCLMEYGGLTLVEAIKKVIFEKLPALNGEGGMIGVDGQGNLSMEFNSTGMYRAACNSQGLHQVAIYD